MNHTPNTYRIIVVGGGAGGLELTTRLGDSLGRSGKAEVILVDSSATHIWKPLLHEVASGSLDSTEDEINYMAHAHWHHYLFQHGRVDRIDPQKKQLSVAPNKNDQGNIYMPRRDLTYDALVLAVGSQVNDFGIPGVNDFCYALDHRKQADEFHQALLRKCFTMESSSSSTDLGQLKIAIAGAGATGVELASELHGAMRHLSNYGLKRLDPSHHINITIVDAAPRILPALPARIVEKVMRQFSELGINVISKEFINEVTEKGFQTQSGLFVPADLMVWATGVKAPDFLSSIPGLNTTETNQVVVNEHLQATAYPDIFALGDCASCPMQNGNMVPPRAQAAHQQASLLARTLKRRLKKKSLLSYRYVDYGSLINLSRYSTVGSLMGNLVGKVSGAVFVEGIIARFVYLSLYKLHQLAIHGVMRTALLTLANLLTRKLKPRMKLH